MLMDTVFDSLCRCFGTNGVGGPGVGGSSGVGGTAMGSAKAAAVDDSNLTTPRPESTSKRRANNANQLLKNEEFDVLFEQQQKSGRKSSTQQSEAQAVAKAKMEAGRRPSKRKATLEGRRDAIFRLHRKVPTHADPKPRTRETAAADEASGSAAPNLVSRFLSSNPNVANALCFATPIRESQDDVLDDNDLVADNDDEHTAHTLNTNGEDTISSTIYFDRKLAHMTESRPPMPLFGEFKVQGGDDDELRRIVATDSHNSLKMISLMEDLKQQQQQQQQHHLPLESEEEEMVKKSKPHHRYHQHHHHHHDPPPPAQMLSDSMSSNSSQSASKTPQKGKTKSSHTRGRTSVRRRRSSRARQQEIQPV